MRRGALVAGCAALLLWVLSRNLHLAFPPSPPRAPSDQAATSPMSAGAQDSDTGSTSAAPAEPGVTPAAHRGVAAVSATWVAKSSAAAHEAAQRTVCGSINCATRHQQLEPDWVNLSFQPAINWKAGGVRGDCVAGELEYIMPKYCSPQPRLPKPTDEWPSEDRLLKADVHSNHLPQAGLTEIATLLKGRTLLLMGDSVMEQFYNTLQCLMRKEALEVPYGGAFHEHVERTRPLWLKGKRKKPPKLPVEANTGMRMLYARVTTMQPDEVEAAIGTADVIVINWGLHYQKMPEYVADLHHALKAFEEHSQQKGKLVIFQETGAQHFKASDRRGYTTGEWEDRDKSADQHCSCQRTEDFNVNHRNTALYEVLGSGKYPHVGLLPFYNLTRPRWRWHFGNCTHRPNGWNYNTCCDCTHFCYSPSMWGAHLHNLFSTLRHAPSFQDFAA